MFGSISNFLIKSGFILNVNFSIFYIYNQKYAHKTLYVLYHYQNKQNPHIFLMKENGHVRHILK